MTKKSDRKYTIIGKGDTPDLALKDTDIKFSEANSKLVEKKIQELNKIVESSYAIECAVEKDKAPDFQGPLTKKYASALSFDDALANAAKGYGVIPFVAQSYQLTQSYQLSKKQQEALYPGTPTTPAGRFDRKKDDISAYLY